MFWCSKTAEQCPTIWPVTKRASPPPKDPSQTTRWTHAWLTANTTTHRHLIHRTWTTRKMCVCQFATSCQMRLTVLMWLRACMASSSTLNWFGQLSGSVSTQPSSPIMCSITLGKRDLYPPCSEASMLCADTPQVKRDALLANCARPRAQLSPSRLSRSLGLMALAAPPSTTST